MRRAGHRPSPVGTAGPAGSAEPPRAPCHPRLPRLPSPGQEPAAQRAPGFGSLGGPAEPAGLPGSLARGCSRSLSPTEELSSPVCRGSSGQSLPRQGAAPAGREQPGDPLLGNAFCAFWSLPGSSKAPQPLHHPQLPSQRRIFGSRAAAPSPSAGTGADGEEWKGMNKPRVGSWILESLRILSTPHAPEPLQLLWETQDAL